MATCPDCSTPAAPGAVVCTECGASIPKAPKPMPKSPQGHPADRLAEGLLRGVSVLMIIVLLALVAFVGWSIISQGIESGAP